MIRKGRRAFWYEHVGHLPLQNPVQLKGESSLEDCILAMQESGLGCVFIVDGENKITGLFTDKDVMEHFVASSLSKQTKIGTVMTKNPITILPNAEVVRAVEIFHEKKVRHLPIIEENGDIKGLLSVRVLMDYVAENLPGEVLNLPPDSTILPTDTEGG